MTMRRGLPGPAFAETFLRAKMHALCHCRRAGIVIAGAAFRRVLIRYNRVGSRQDPQL
jgi:hypothetical protein